jgi:hypothetical protein
VRLEPERYEVEVASTEQLYITAGIITPQSMKEETGKWFPKKGLILEGIREGKVCPECT